MLDIDGRVVAVTGATGGLGYSTVLQLARGGARIVANYWRSRERAEQLASEVGEIVLARGDLRVEQTAAEIAATAVAAYGRLDVLIHCAGVTRDVLLVRMTEQDWDDVMTVNAKAAFFCTKHALPVMIRQKYGKLIYVSSIAALVGNGGQANYAASKAALHGLAYTVAQEYGRYGIRSVILAPGVIDAGMTRHLSVQQLKPKVERTILGFAGTESDVARILAFLSSPSSDYINSTVIRLDGGIGF